MRISAKLAAGILGAVTVVPCFAADEPVSPLATVTPEEALAIDALLTTINGEPIYAKDVIRPLDAEFKAMARQMAEQKRPLRDFRAAAEARLFLAMQETVRNILMYSAAKDALGEDEIRRVDVVMNAEEKKILAQFKGSRALADASLRANGSSLDRELIFRRRQLTVALYQHKVLVPQINVRRRDVTEEYEANIARYTVVPEVDLHVIRIHVSDFLKDAEGKPLANPTEAQIKDAESKAWAEAKAIHKRLKDGAEFSTEAARNINSDPRGKTQGGHYPHEKLKSWKWKELAEKAFAAESHSILEPFPAVDPKGDPKQSVVFVLKVGEVVKGRVKSFEEVQEEITHQLQQEQEAALDKIMVHKLYEKSAIDNKDELQRVIETVTKVVVARYAVKEEQ
jgi:hypothetical protein